MIGNFFFAASENETTRKGSSACVMRVGTAVIGVTPTGKTSGFENTHLARRIFRRLRAQRPRFEAAIFRAVQNSGDSGAEFHQPSLANDPLDLFQKLQVIARLPQTIQPGFQVFADSFRKETIGTVQSVRSAHSRSRSIPSRQIPAQRRSRHIFGFSSSAAMSIAPRST